MKEMLKLLAAKEIWMVFTLANLKMEKEMVMEFFVGIMEKFSKVNGRMVWKMDLELGNHPKEIIMKVNGFKTGSMDKDYLGIKQAHIKVNSKIS